MTPLHRPSSSTCTRRLDAMRVLVTDGDNRAALAITRSLGREGHYVTVGADRPVCMAGVSRYCSERFIYPDPLQDPSGFNAALLEFVKRKKPDVIMPVSEITTILATGNAELSRYSRIPFPEVSTVQKAANKVSILKLALQLDVPIPETLFLESRVESKAVLAAGARLGFPVVLKPARSRFLKEGRWMNGAVSYARDLRELKSRIDCMPSESFPLMLQKRVAGPGVGVFLLADRGRIVSVFSHKRIREKPPSGGVSVLRESIPVDTLLSEYSERLIKALEWHGVGMVEFKWDGSAGRYVLMEINGRFWGSLQLAIDAGVNFPATLLEIAAGSCVTPSLSYQIGVKTRWFWGDLDALLIRLFHPDGKLALPPDFPTRLRCILDFCRLNPRNQKFEVFEFADIRPWLLESLRWLAKG